MAYNIDESINVQGSPEIGVWHEPEFKKYQVFSNNNGTIILPERLSKEYSPRLICNGISMNRVYDITLLNESEEDNNFYFNNCILPESYIFCPSSKVSWIKQIIL